MPDFKNQWQAMCWVPRFGVLKIQSWHRCHVGQAPCPQSWLASSEDDWLSLRTEQVAESPGTVGIADTHHGCQCQVVAFSQGTWCSVSHFHSETQPVVTHWLVDSALSHWVSKGGPGYQDGRQAGAHWLGGGSVGQGGTGRYHCPPEAYMPPCSAVTAVVTPSSGTPMVGCRALALLFFFEIRFYSERASCLSLSYYAWPHPACCLGTLKKNVDNSS